MEIAIQSTDELEQLRTRLRKMTDAQLVSFGKAARFLCRDQSARTRLNVGPAPFDSFMGTVVRPKGRVQTDSKLRPGTAVIFLERRDGTVLECLVSRKDNRQRTRTPQ